MNKDIIYRADAIDAIHGYWKGELSKMPTTDSEYGEVIDGECDTLLKHNKELSTRIKDIPPADRPQGEWITKTVKKLCAPDCWYPGAFAIEGSWDEEEGSWFEEEDGFCSECGEQDEHYYSHNYCPNCGSKMKGADNEKL